MLTLVIFFAFYFAAVCNAFYDCPRDSCDTCLPIEIHDAPGVGFNLTPSYGTSAVHFFNGTVVQVAQIQGEPEYLQLMARFAKEADPTSHEATGLLQGTYSRLYSLLESPLPSLAGWLKRKLARPLEVDDVYIIREMLQNLKYSTERKLRQSLDRVAVTTPDIEALSPEIINSALRGLNLRTWLGDSKFYPDRLVEADAVYAANGYRLCKNYHDLFECTDEFDLADSSTILYISFSRAVLYASVIRPINGEALSRFTRDEAQVLDFEVGLDRLLQTNYPDLLWSRLRSQLITLSRSSKFPITHLVLAGESARNPRFLDNLKDSLTAISQPIITSRIESQFDFMAPVQEQKTTDPTFTAARGAALYARRRQEVQEDCSEPAECELLRQEERSNSLKRENLH
ncbi:hypothetical protein N7447_000351 [Penicillium robsamsonii]|uniref:uncharacterized protein n=1 Tax=Penicillium robsamsonii TaxID=1792511 RepID=UPI002547A4CF|nr:uncharacterized protein N7447_000351 [Penicillium robsamsonii]KAJ5834325.1 hypothetical protein N7447_000351 [Penicillium robsamsonii]